MDFIKKAAGSFGGKKEEHKTGEQKDDYVDKAFGAIAGKTGYKIDRNTQEKITDGGREAYEKYSGKKVDPKYSN